MSEIKLFQEYLQNINELLLPKFSKDYHVEVNFKEDLEIFHIETKKLHGAILATPISDLISSLDCLIDRFEILEQNFEYEDKNDKSKIFTAVLKDKYVEPAWRKVQETLFETKPTAYLSYLNTQTMLAVVTLSRLAEAAKNYKDFPSLYKNIAFSEFNDWDILKSKYNIDKKFETTLMLTKDKLVKLKQVLEGFINEKTQSNNNNFISFLR